MVLTHYLAKIEAELDPWIAGSTPSLIASFATGIKKVKASVCAAVIEPWLSSEIGGRVTKLKLVKRQMLGRVNIDLLQARLIGAA